MRMEYTSCDILEFSEDISGTGSILTAHQTSTWGEENRGERDRLEEIGAEQEGTEQNRKEQ